MAKQYIQSERAHLMCPNMQFALLGVFQSAYHEEKVANVLRKLEASHPFLKSKIDCDANGYFYAYDKEQTLSIYEPDNVEDIVSGYRRITKKGWDVTKEPLLKLYLYPNEEHCTILFIAHHLLCDGKGLANIVLEFADLYEENKLPEVKEEHLLASINDLPMGSELPWMSKNVIQSINKKWLKEEHQVTYQEYLAFEKDYLESQNYKIEFNSLVDQHLKEIKTQCKNNGVTINDYLVAKMMNELHTKKVIVAADIRKDLANYQEGSLGNFSTAFSVTGNDKKDILKLAQDIHKETQDVLNNPKKKNLVLSCYFKMDKNLLDAVSISTLGNYPSKAAKFVGSKLFGFKKRDGYGISNLGQIQNNNILDMVFIPPFSPANKYMQGVVTINGKMNIVTIQK